MDMILPTYLSFVIPLTFLLLVVKGETRGIIVFFAAGMSAAMVVYIISGFISEEVISPKVQIFYLFPFLEEITKLIPLLCILKTVNRSFKYILPRYALAVGIGFSVLENNLYLSMAAQAAESLPAVYIIIRSLTASLLHGSACALSGYVLQIMINNSFKSPALLIGTLLGGFTIHSLFNSMVSPKMLGVAVFIPLGIFVFLVFVLNAFGISVIKGHTGNQRGVI
jgi:RsiW-degrading membrane proteinase PrsW (M82 family)